MKKMKNILSVALALLMIISIIPISSIEAEAAGKMTLSQLQAKFPSGKYWNGGNADSYTSSPCTHHDNCTYSGSCGCNSFKGLSIQCMGYAEKLGFDFTGYNPRNNANGWNTNRSTSALDSLKPGDIVRYKNDNHSIFVTKVSGDTVTYTDCNSDGHCKIRWGVTISKSTLKSSFTYVRSAPYSIDGNNTLSIKYDSNGGIIAGSDKTYNVYKVAVSEGVNLRSGAGTSYSTVTAMPKGTSFVVTETAKANGYTWGKTTYNSKTGWCVISEDWTTKTGTQPQTKYYLNSSDVVYKSSNGKVFVQAMVDGTTYSDGLYNYTTFGISRTGYTFKGWGTTSSGGTIYSQSDPMTAKKLCSTIADGDKTITLYAIWAPNELSVYYNANGGKVTLDEFTLNSGVIYKNSEKFVQTWQYNTTKDNGLINPKSFGLEKTGYSFAGWGTTSSGGTIFDQNDTGLLPIEINANVKNGNCSSTLYAIWKGNTYTVKYNANGGSGTISDSSHTYDTAKTLNANTFTKTGYTFLGWSTSSTATTAQYTDKQSVKNLTATNGGTVTLYAVWSKNAHTPGEWSIVTPATCTSTGLTRQKCTVCGEIIAEVELPAIEHTASGWEVIIQASCATDGMRQKSCTVCNTIIAKEEIAATGHSVGGWEIVTEATCTTEGFKQQKCTVCKEVVNSEEIPMVEHTFINGLCATCGEEDPSYTEPEYNYTFTIQEPSRTTIRNKDGIILHSNIEGTAPTGSYVDWSWNNSKFDVEKNNDGTLTIISENNGKTTFTATLYRADGEVLATDSIEMKSKAGFFDKIGSFFRSLFGGTKIYEN